MEAMTKIPFYVKKSIIVYKVFWETLEATHNYSNAIENLGTDPKQKILEPGW